MAPKPLAKQQIVKLAIQTCKACAMESLMPLGMQDLDYLRAVHRCGAGDWGSMLWCVSQPDRKSRDWFFLHDIFLACVLDLWWFYVLVCRYGIYAMKLTVLVTAIAGVHSLPAIEEVTFILPQAAGESLLQEIRKVWPLCLVMFGGMVRCWWKKSCI